MVKVTSISLPVETHNNLKKIAHIKQVGINAVVKKLVEDYVAQNMDLVNRFNKTFPELNK